MDTEILDSEAFPSPGAKGKELPLPVESEESQELQESEVPEEVIIETAVLEMSSGQAANQGVEVDQVIFHPGPGETLDGLPDVTAVDVRTLGGETLEAAGPVAVIAAAERVRKGAKGVLVAFRDLGGLEGAALVVRRA